MTAPLITPLSRDVLLGWQIVVCDDEEDSLEVATRILRYYKATVHSATNGKDALDMVQQVLPRVLISDLSMPIMDGWELLYEVKNDPLTAEIPCIALTAHAMTGDRDRAINAGFQNYITKPLSPITFVHELLAALATPRTRSDQAPEAGVLASTVAEAENPAAVMLPEVIEAVNNPTTDLQPALAPQDLPQLSPAVSPVKSISESVGIPPSAAPIANSHHDEPATPLNTFPPTGFHNSPLV